MGSCGGSPQVGVYQGGQGFGGASRIRKLRRGAETTNGQWGARSAIASWDFQRKGMGVAR